MHLQETSRRSKIDQEQAYICHVSKFSKVGVNLRSYRIHHRCQDILKFPCIFFNLIEVTSICWLRDIGGLNSSVRIWLIHVWVLSTLWLLWSEHDGKVQIIVVEGEEWEDELGGGEWIWPGQKGGREKTNWRWKRGQKETI